MSGFDLSELLPFYLDETDEQIAVLNAALLELERDPAEAKSLQEAFRIAHSIKGASSVMGFEQVKQLTHHLENYFDQIRGGRRQLDRPALDVCFRCLDDLRDFHQKLRSEGQSEVSLADSIKLVHDRLGEHAPATTTPAPAPEAAPPEPQPAPVEIPEPPPVPPPAPVIETPASPTPPQATPSLLQDTHRIGLTIFFEPNLQWRDMKARLVLNRLSSKVKILATDPPIETLESESLPSFTVWIATDRDVEELVALADVDGVARIQILGEEPPQAEAAPPEFAQDVSADPPPLADTPATTSEPPSAPPPPSEPEVAAPPRTPPPQPDPPRNTIATQPALPAEPTPVPSAKTKRPKVAETLRVDVDRLDHLMNLAGELVINKARFSQIASAMDELFRDTKSAVLAADAQDRLDVILLGLQTLADTGAVSEGVLGRWEAHFRRLRDNLRTVRARLEQLDRAQEQLAGLRESIDQLNRVTQSIQKGVLETRMVPIGPLFDRFRRVIRDLAVTSGKDVELRLTGESTELDKRMIDELADPLIHMVRNSVDHGLELPDAREAAGKPRTGTVTLQASHRGNSIVITVSDDGRGIDAERLRRKVVEQRLLRADEAAALEPRQLIPFIFHPGLSTAEQVTEISGRGVGMDIVKSRIEALNGSVDVRSEPGKGTTFTIRLPLTLAILPSLLVRIFDEVYSLPLDAIEEIVEVHPDQIFSIHGRRTIDIRKRVISVVALGDVFRWGGAEHPSLRGQTINTNPSHRKAQVVLLGNGDTTIGLQVDDLIGIQEIVLKSLERHFQPVRGLSGASILGNGRVCLILDIDAFINLLDPRAARPRSASERTA